MADGRGVGGGGGGGGGGRGMGASHSRRDHAALGDAELVENTPNVAGFNSEAEAYPGEFEDSNFLYILLSEEEQPPLIEELFGQAAAPAQSDTTPAGNTAETVVTAPIDSEIYAEITESEATLTIIIESAENVDSSLMASDVSAEITENEANLNNIMVPVEDASAEHALRSSNHRDEFVMVPFNMILVEQDQGNQGNVVDLYSYLRQEQWEHALQVLRHMVEEGEADNGAVEAGAPERDIYKAHPELVLWLRGQTYVDLRKKGCALAAEVYYRDHIADLYPDGVSTGSSYADSVILGTLKKIKRTGSPLRGNKAFADGKETRRCVEDYLMVYFPGYRPQLRDTDSRIWEFGLKEDGTVRCLLCHKDYRGLNLTKLEQHLLGHGHGRQGKCPAVTDYVTRRLELILQAEELAGSRRRVLRAVVRPRDLPPPPPPPPPDAEES